MNCKFFLILFSILLIIAGSLGKEREGSVRQKKKRQRIEGRREGKNNDHHKHPKHPPHPSKRPHPTRKHRPTFKPFPSPKPKALNVECGDDDE
uniref:Candidate secreted effector n=1 Tax=Meloidogyne incognita TaxID=6306 RepID=A0A914MLM7_MELIC